MPKEPVNKRYEADTKEELEESIQSANEDFDRLVAEGYPSIEIIISNHWASEGVWVEAGDKPNKHSSQDHVYRTNQK
jgi:hypothetical protein